MIRLVAFAAARWDRLQAEHPDIDLIKLPFGRFLAIMYQAYAETWAAGERKDRPETSPEPTYDEFEAQMDLPLPGEPPSRQSSRDEFLDDYRALMGE